MNQDQAIQELIYNNPQTEKALAVLKRKLALQQGNGIVKNSDIFKVYSDLLLAKKIKPSKNLEKILRKRAIRTLSGVAPVAVLTKPFGCPNNCVYCPTEDRVPKSYLSNEPAVMRAIRSEYDPYKQVIDRLKALTLNGHHPTKIEIIIIGGTWSALPENYRYWFVKECFRAANEFRMSDVGCRISDDKNNSDINLESNFSLDKIKNQLFNEQKKNEKAKYRIIGLTVETRPDFINYQELERLRELGCTRVEIGVQMIDDKVLELNQRGHSVEDIAKATENLRNWGFKITYHWMPGLPGSNLKKDLDKFKELFTDARFQPDQIKFYPTVVVKNSLLYDWWKNGRYIPYSDAELQELIIECKKVIPRYVRIIRLIRDIPAESIEAGNALTNLRQIMQNKGAVCECIRCREPHEEIIDEPDCELIVYKASEGEEYFISYKTKKDDKILGFCRLRLPCFKKNKNDIPLFLKGVALIRELHVYGELTALGEKGLIQHSGLGKKLIKQAERIATRQKFKKLAIISAVGARGYYRKLGYRLYKTYMIKKFTNRKGVKK